MSCVSDVSLSQTSLNSVPLAYILAFDGQFATADGDIIDIECHGLYNNKFAANTYSMMLQVDALLGTTLCQGHDARMMTSAAYLVVYETQVRKSRCNACRPTCIVYIRTYDVYESTSYFYQLHAFCHMQGVTFQSYAVEPGSDMLFSDMYACAQEIEWYLSAHSNWQLPIIPQEPGCPEIVFQPEVFTLSSEEWLCMDN